MKSRSQIAVEALDEVAGQMERKWGVGRLPRLVGVFLAEKFHSQAELLDQALKDEATGGSMANVEYHAGRMVNAWMALNAAAEAAGAVPASGKYMTARMADGRSLVICVDSEAVGVWHAENKGSAAAVWTMGEVAKVLEGLDLVNRTKHLFEGATITDVRGSASFNWNKGDDLPPEMLLAYAG